MSTGAVEPTLEAVGRSATDEHGGDAALLDGYLPTLLAVAATSRRLSSAETDVCRRIGGEAAGAGVGLPSLVDLYMSASRRLWPHLPRLVGAVRGRPVQPIEMVGIGEVVWRAADDALGALAQGYVDAQRLVVRREETHRREFIDDLLAGQSDIGSLVDRADSYGLSLAGAHVVAVAQAEQPIGSAGRITSWVEQAARARFGSRGMLVTAKDGRLVCAVSATASADREHGQEAAGRQLAEIAGQAAAELSNGAPWRVGLSRAHSGPHGIFRSYLEALEALDLAGRLALVEPVVHARDLLVYRVLLRDETAMADLVDAVLGPLLASRDGPERLLVTLEAYFAAGANTTAAARRLHLSVRAMTYRLQRVTELTGYSVTEPAHMLPLHVAVTGARLLGWSRRTR